VTYIAKIGKFLLATVEEDLDDQQALDLQDKLSQRLESAEVRCVVLDISSLVIVDSFVGRVLSDISRTLALMGGETIVVGMQPPVAMTLVELGLKLPGIRTALTLEHAMEYLEFHADSRET